MQDNNLLPLPSREQRLARNTRFTIRNPKQKPSLAPSDLHKLQVKQLVESPLWTVLTDAARRYANQFNTGLPAGSMSELIGYSVNSIVQDTIQAFINELEDLAAKAPDPANFQPNEVH